MGRLSKIIVICGPTAVGKTSLSLQLTRKFAGEIISADSRQIYRNLNIGTDKVSQSLREMKRQFNSSLYERLALSKDKEGVKKLSENGQLIVNQSDVIKDPLVLEFLGLDEKTRYSETKPIQLSEFENLEKWWKKRKENENAWKVDIETIRKSGYNLDIKNPHQPEPEKTYSSSELLEMLHTSFEKSDKLLKKLQEELN